MPTTSRHPQPTSDDRPEAGEWFHVVQRGLGRRPVFPRAQDIRRLLDLVGREVSRGRVEVHAYAVLTNHCHLLIHGQSADVSAAMQRVMGSYARHLNRRLRRDGPLFGSRSRIRCIRTSGHWAATLAYIDRNPVDAGLVRAPHLYPFGSAWHYARLSGPSWLTRTAVEAHVRQRSGRRNYRPEDYEQALGVDAVPDGARHVVERRIDRREEPDPLDDLLAAATPEVRRWLERMAQRADGGAVGPALVDPDTMLEVLGAMRRKLGAWKLKPMTGLRRPADSGAARGGGVQRVGWTVLSCGLLRTSCGLALEEIGARVGLSVGGVYFQIRCHEQRIGLDDQYRERATQALQQALRRDYPDARRRSS